MFQIFVCFVDVNVGMFVLSLQDLSKIMELLCDVCTCMNFAAVVKNLVKIDYSIAYYLG